MKIRFYIDENTYLHNIEDKLNTLKESFDIVVENKYTFVDLIGIKEKSEMYNLKHWKIKDSEIFNKKCFVYSAENNLCIKVQLKNSCTIKERNNIIDSISRNFTYQLDGCIIFIENTNTPKDILLSIIQNLVEDTCIYSIVLANQDNSCYIEDSENLRDYDEL
jgi:hypothetical protein